MTNRLFLLRFFDQLLAYFQVSVSHTTTYTKIEKQKDFLSANKTMAGSGSVMREKLASFVKGQSTITASSNADQCFMSYRAVTIGL